VQALPSSHSVPTGNPTYWQNPLPKQVPGTAKHWLGGESQMTPSQGPGTGVVVGEAVVVG
jgi:hypothetical protein